MSRTVKVSDHRTEAEIRARIASLYEYGRAGWLPSIEAGNYAINELHWVLGEELLDAAFDETNWDTGSALNASRTSSSLETE